MSYDLRLPKRLKTAGWKVKIYDLERLEPPHLTILFKSRSAWRLSLRDGTFLDVGHDWSQIDDSVKTVVEREWDTLQKAWNRMYPKNPISSEKDD